MLGRIFGSEREREREEVTGGWEKLRNEKFHNLSSSSNIIMLIKLRRMKWTGCVSRHRRDEKCPYTFSRRT
jgi:hypothetical protein